MSTGAPCDAWSADCCTRPMRAAPNMKFPYRCSGAILGAGSHADFATVRVSDWLIILSRQAAQAHVPEPLVLIIFVYNQSVIGNIPGARHRNGGPTIHDTNADRTPRVTGRTRWIV